MMGKVCAECDAVALDQGIALVSVVKDSSSLCDESHFLTYVSVKTAVGVGAGWN